MFGRCYDSFDNLEVRGELTLVSLVPHFPEGEVGTIDAASNTSLGEGADGDVTWPELSGYGMPKSCPVQTDRPRAKQGTRYERLMRVPCLDNRCSFYDPSSIF